MHSRTTAREIIEDFKDEQLDYWVTGYGTGGTLKGVARVLAKEMPDTKIVVCEPADAPMLSSGIGRQRKEDGSPAAAHPALKPHPMQGWAPDFIPKLTADAVASNGVSQDFPHRRTPTRLRCSRELAQKEGIFVGITAGATLAGALQLCAERAKGLDDPRDAAGHRRTLPQHATVRRHPGGHDRGRAEDFAIDAERAHEAVDMTA